MVGPERDLPLLEADDVEAILRERDIAVDAALDALLEREGEEPSPTDATPARSPSEG